MILKNEYFRFYINLITLNKDKYIIYFVKYIRLFLILQIDWR